MEGRRFFGATVRIGGIGMTDRLEKRSLFVVVADLDAENVVKIVTARPTEVSWNCVGFHTRRSAAVLRP